MEILIVLGKTLIVALVLSAPLIAFFSFINQCEKEKQEFYKEYYKSKGEDNNE